VLELSCVEAIGSNYVLFLGVFFTGIFVYLDCVYSLLIFLFSLFSLI